MAATRRLAKVEGSLSALATTLLWLEEAHAFGSLPAYVAWLIDQPIAAAPLVRVAEAAEDAVIRAMPRKSEDARAPAIRTAVRDAAFRVELIIGLNRAAQELLEAGGLRCAAFFWQRRALVAEGGLGETNPAHWADWRDAVAELLTELYATEDARTRLEARFIDGHPTLFPDASIAWEQLRDGVERLVGLGIPPASAPEATPRRRKAPLSLAGLQAAARDRVSALVDEVLAAARAVTLEVLGDSAAAAALVEQRLRAGSR